MKNTENKKKIRLTISSDRAPRLCCEAMMTERDGAAYILYRHENEPCSIKVRGSRVTVIRHGQRHAHGDRRGCRAYVAVCYAHGALSFEIAAHKVDNMA